MQLNNIKRETARKLSRSVGRGGKRGKTSGRGTKGQKARAGRKIRPEARDVIMRIPKLRGYRFKSRFGSSAVVPLELLDKHFSSGDEVTPKVLVDKGLVGTDSGTIPEVKILSKGEISKKISIKGCAISASAKSKLEKAGGSVS